MKRSFFIAFIFLGGCASSLNKVESTRETNNITNEYNYSDPESEIRYQITNDHKNLHIKLNTADFTTITKILKTGLKICFDVQGKKNEQVYFQYPLARDQQFTEHDRSKQGNGQASRFDLSKIVSQIPNEAIFNRNGEIERILLLSKDSDIKASIRTINNNEIIYDVYIPISRISKDGIASLSKLSVGINSGKMDTPSREGKSGEASGEGGSEGRGGRSGGGMSGGGRGGMSGGGRHGGGMQGGGGYGGMDRSAMSKPVKFWFQLDLIKE